jgi:hypothetical protein
MAAGLLAVVALAAAIVVWRAQADWATATERLERRLRSGAARTLVSAYREADALTLPPPVARYFRAALRDGQPIVTRARIDWQGEFNTGKPGKDAWKPFTATQEIVPGAPGFVWNARIAMAPGLPVLVRDGFVEGKGSMRGAVLGLVEVVGVEGTPEIAQGALQRYLAEAVWVPTSLLPSQGVAWTPIDATRAQATLTAGSSTVALEFRFGGDGLVASVFAPDRFYDDGRHPPVARPWLARNLRYEQRHGITLPADAVVEWQLPEGALQYWRGRPLKIEYEYAAGAAR